MLENIVVVGASLAGLRGAEALRRLGYEGRLTVVGEEPHAPYDRPPLSKEVLAGKWDPERTQLRSAIPPAEQGIELELGVRATALDVSARKLTLDRGGQLDFDGLLIATGASPRRLPGLPEREGIHFLRTLDDCMAIRAELDRAPRVAVVGAGFIGAEVAATCRARGLEVAVIEALPAPLSRGLGMEMGGWMAEVHRENGVDLRCGVTVEKILGDRRVEGLLLSDGNRVSADLVVIGVGVAPRTDWLEGSGLELRDGVVCDSRCATAAPDIVAAGDVARWPNALFGEEMRIEHWTHAVEQGEAAATRLLVGETCAPFAPVPFFWSDQYGIKIQLAGRTRADDETRVVHGTLAERKCVVLYGRAGKLVGALGFSRARWVMKYRGLIAQGVAWEDAIAQAEA